MLIVYDTFTVAKNTEKFVHKLPYECCHISEYDGFSDFILVTYTINFGQVPDTVVEFMNKHYKKCLGVSSSGNKVWGSNYGAAADKLSNAFGVPFISKFELQGTNKDVEHFIERIGKIVKMD